MESQAARHDSYKRLPYEEMRLLLNNMISPFSYYRMIYDKNGHAVDYEFLAVNKAFEAETGLRREDVIGKRILEVYPNTERYWIEHLGRVARTGVPMRLSSFSSALNNWYDVLAYSPKPNHVAMTVNNITKLIRRQQELQEKTLENRNQRDEIAKVIYHNPITSLPNVSLLKSNYDELQLVTYGAARAAFLYIGVNNYHDISMAYGGDFSNRLITRLAERVKECECETCSVYHIGDDRLLLFMRQADDCGNAEGKALSLLNHIDAPIEIDGDPFSLMISCGIACCPTHGTDFNDLLMKSESAMYRASRAGGGTYAFYSDTTRKEQLQRIEIRNHLQTALNKREFYLCYQPQVHTDTRHISGFEALIRWNSPDLGNVPPMSFIGIAEDSHIILPIGEWVLKTACDTLKNLNERYQKNYSMSVNVSVVQIVQDSFVDRITSIINESGVDFSLIELEITESLFLKADSTVINKLNELVARGIRISLDDFGTGYSSLSSLNALTIHALKLDRSFMKGSRGSLAEGIVKMGKLLRTEVIAEGVETEDQLHTVTELGCDRVQGYVIAKPMALSDLIPFIEQYDRA